MKNKKNNLVEQGIQFRDKKEYQKAIDTLILAKSDPDLFKDACYELAQTYYGLGKIAESRAELSEVLKIEPLNPEFTTLSGLLYIKEGEIDQAIKVLEETINRNPDHINAAQILQSHYAYIGDYEAEHDLLVKLLPTYKDDPCFLYSYSIVMVERSTKSNQLLFNEALKHLESIKNNGFNDIDLEFYIGKAYFRLGDYKKCIDHIGNYLSEKNKYITKARKHIIFFHVAKNDAPIFEKSIPALEKHGDKVFVEKLDKSQSHMTDIKRGPIYEPGEVVKL